jgi:hypothetical protein
MSTAPHVFGKMLVRMLLPSEGLDFAMNGYNLPCTTTIELLDQPRPQAWFYGEGLVC